MEELIKKAQNGDKSAFTTLMLLLKTDLYKIAKTRLKNDEDIYDAIQETMIMAFKSIKKLKKIQSFKAWIFKILINQSNNIHIKNNKKKNIIALEDVENYKITEYYNDEIESIETTLDFKFICQNLKYEDRLIIILYYMEEFTDKEIGKILNLKENTVKTKRTRAKQEIKSIIKRGEKMYG